MDWVQKKIQQANVERWAQLDLGKAGLREIPPEVFDLESLETLVLGDRFYDFQRNQWVGSENEGAPNYIVVIPRQITRLTNLRELFLGRTQVSDLPPLQGLANLTTLYLRDNNIGAEGAQAIATLSGLTTLYLDNNNIGVEGAQAIATLSGLTTLYLRDNNIGAEGVQALLDAWAESPTAHYLVSLYLDANGDLSSILPSEVLGTSDAQTILAAYRRYRDSEQHKTLSPLNEAKLLVVGNEAVGKTSLIRYLILNEPRNPNEPKTPGTAIHERIETQPWRPEQIRITLNVWDFGGQEIMHGTHRFFLTERSLYLLVLEARREDDNSVYDWLKIIRNRGGDSPVIVVINKCDDDTHNLRLDETGLKQNYPAIVDFMRTSCDPGETATASIALLRKRIADTLADDDRLKHIHDPLPQSWLRVKETVAQLARAECVLPWQAFVELCQQPTSPASDHRGVITDKNEQRALLRLLHDLGVVVAHGLSSDAPAVLREITLLDPNWLTGAIYKLLNNSTIRDQGGEFSREQFNLLLDPQEYPPQWHEYILGMMQHPDVGLCFRLLGDERERYLIPEALPPNAPDYDMWPADSLRFRFTYDFLPPGLIPRFIVQAHRNLTDSPTRWRTGVVLGAAGCPILVRGDRDRRRIDITVAGPATRQRSALNVVLNDLEDVHKRNPEVGHEARVPLPDRPDLDVSYDHLLRLEDRYGLDHKFDPENADRAYTVRELLEGVRHDSSRVGVEQDHYRIEARDNARVTVIEGSVRSYNDDAQSARPISRDVPQSPRAPTFSSWRFFSITCGLVAIVLVIVLWLLPSNEWRAIVGGLIGLGVLVTTFMLSMNPAFFYRRLLSYVIPSGILVNATGFAFDAFLSSGTTVGGFRWDGTVSGVFFVAWAAVVGFLVWGDSKQNS